MACVGEQRADTEYVTTTSKKDVSFLTEQQWQGKKQGKHAPLAWAVGLFTESVLGDRASVR